MHFGKYTNNYPPIYFLSSEMSYAWDNQDFVDLMRVLALIFFILLFMAGLLLAMEVIFKHFNIDLWTASPTNDGHPLLGQPRRLDTVAYIAGDEESGIVHIACDTDEELEQILRC